MIVDEAALILSTCCQHPLLSSSANDAGNSVERGLYADKRAVPIQGPKVSAFTFPRAIRPLRLIRFDPPNTFARLRSVSGVAIGLYVTMHLSNHALGLISLHAQEAARPWVMALWHSPLGQILLYGSLSVHAFCGLTALARRRQYRMPIWEATQMLPGLAIPYLLLVHIVNTRGTRILTGIDINYTYEIANLWVDPWTRFRQILLVLLVWGHFSMGLHFWLRIYAWYRRAFPIILLFYVLVPIGALLGFAEVGMATSAHARLDPVWFKEMKSLGIPADSHRAAVHSQTARTE